MHSVVKSALSAACGLALASAVRAGDLSGTIHGGGLGESRRAAANPYPGMLGALDIDASDAPSGSPGLVVFADGALRAEGAPEGDWSLAQRGQRFEPAVLGIPVGATVAFPNFDPVFHNVFSYSKTKRFDLGRYGKGKSRSVQFEDPGVVRIFCDIHSNMSATIVVANSHYVTTTDARGDFTLKNLPNGEVVLVAVDGEGNRRDWKVRVGQDPVHVDFDF